MQRRRPTQATFARCGGTTLLTHTYLASASPDSIGRGRRKFFLSIQYDFNLPYPCFQQKKKMVLSTLLL